MNQFGEMKRPGVRIGKESAWSRVNQSKTLGELCENIPAEFLQKAASVLLLVWVFTPIAAMLLNIVYWSSVIWILSLNFTGIGGLFIGIVMFGKSINKAKQEKTSFTAYLVRDALPIFLFLMLIWSLLSAFAADTDTYDLFFGNYYRQDGIMAYFTYCGVFC